MAGRESLTCGNRLNAGFHSKVSFRPPAPSSGAARKDLPLDRLRDRVLFETAYVCGARASEVCGLYVEDLDLRLDEHVRIHGKGGSVRTVLLDDRGYVALLKLYLTSARYSAGPLFRASINGRGHASTETTQLYALLEDKIADAEIRAARRRRDTTR
ncbi:tyrosine-type recombinase/integrase [Nonomuraea sp. NPDC050451]|uniref:tyrosine-type recombinase/integrase n=1 Tax=Nonomuraea sp. NPDC050451 TaxID=3364364 RepID=UPI0037B31C8A